MEEVIAAFDGLIELRNPIFRDERGWFTETFKSTSFMNRALTRTDFVQDNLSNSAAGVLRGLHFQAPPHAQAKLVMVISGKALDVVVDIRKNSATYGKHCKVILDSEEKNQLFIPRGFAHGFLALEDNTMLLYKCDNEYDSASERTLLWSDPMLEIDWPITSPIVSEKDQIGLRLQELDSPF